MYHNHEISPTQRAVNTDTTIITNDIEELEEDVEQSELFEHFRFVADAGQSPIRIDKFLVDRMPNVSRNRIQLASEAGTIFVNDKAVRSNYKVKPRDLITIKLDRPPYENRIDPEAIPLNILYEDEYLLVVNKQAGLVVHPGHGNYTGTLLNALAYHFRGDARLDLNDPQIGLVHRIDKDTSGLLVIAKTAEVKTHLSRQFFEKSTERTYQALVWGKLSEEQGTIRTNLARSEKNRLQIATYPYQGSIGKSAVTHYQLLQRLGFVSLIECILETGRTHQIRVHMQSLGHPIFNDERYGGDQILRGNRFSSYKKFVENCFELCPRQALHAKSLGFYHPIRCEMLRFDSPLPSDMEQLVHKWEHYTRFNNTEEGLDLVAALEEPENNNN